MTPMQIEEINRIHAAVDDFASAMKTRLTQKVEEGYCGWDDPDGCPSQPLRQGMLQDAVIVHGTHNDDKTVDIANRAMMLWYRANDQVDFQKGARSAE